MGMIVVLDTLIIARVCSVVMELWSQLMPWAAAACVCQDTAALTAKIWPTTTLVGIWFATMAESSVVVLKDALATVSKGTLGTTVTSILSARTCTARMVDLPQL